MRTPTVPAPDPLLSWRDPRHRRGLAGERAAIAYLLRTGWSIEAHRFRFGHHDLDLVARKGRIVAFIEVKTRRSSRFGPPEGSIRSRKQGILTRLATLWRLKFGRADDSYRFDVIAVLELASGPSPQITHIEDAWRGVEK
ncbi:MAG: YraN family protein [Gemmatimonadales bacterium]